MADGRPRGRPRAATSARAAPIVKGKPDEAMAKADATIEATYSLPVITHVCLEPHGLTAKWEGDDTIVAWASTQAVAADGQRAGRAVRASRSTNVTVLTEVMGGGFGSKFGADIWGLDRGRAVEEGRRPARQDVPRPGPGAPRRGQPPQRHRPRSSSARPRTASSSAMIAETHGTGGVGGGSQFPLPVRLRRPRLVADPHRRLRQRRRRPRHAGPGPPPGLRHHGSGHGRPGRQARDRPARVPAQEPAPRRLQDRRSTRPRSRSAPS